MLLRVLSSTSEIRGRLLSLTEATIANNFDFALKIVQARGPQDLLQIESDFISRQAQHVAEQSKHGRKRNGRSAKGGKDDFPARGGNFSEGGPCRMKYPSKPLMEVNMYSPNDQARKPDLGSRYGEIGISAVAAALHYRSGMKIGASRTRRAKGAGDRCDPKVRPHGKQPPDARLSRKKQIIQKNASTTLGFTTHGQHWRKDAETYTFLM